MFKKLELPIIDIDLKLLKGEVNYQNNSFIQYRINNFSTLHKNVTSKIKFQIKPDIIQLTEIGYPGTDPHTDTWPVALNYYVNVSGNTTHFWKPTNNVSYKREKGLTGFNILNLTPSGTFTANIADWYLINVNEIHSVQVDQGSEPRLILRYVWKNYSFEEILQSFET